MKYFNELVHLGELPNELIHIIELQVPLLACTETMQRMHGVSVYISLYTYLEHY